MSASLPKILAVVGPTASGKSKIAIDIAKHYNGEIISADSIQIYRYFDIGSAKPSQIDFQSINHYLLDQLLPDEEYNAAIFAERAQQHIIDILEQKKLPIIVGGTGLYIKSLLYGLVDTPFIHQEVHHQVEQLYQKEAIEGCYRYYQTLDPEGAKKLKKNDQTRILRALKVILITNQSIFELQAKHQFQEKRFNILYIGGNNDRTTLYPRINQRVEMMVEAGLIQEIKSILARGYDRNIKPFQSIGYKEGLIYLDHQASLDETINKIQINTRRYAKRQLTWYNKTSILWNYFDCQNKIREQVAQFLE